MDRMTDKELLDQMVLMKQEIRKLMGDILNAHNEQIVNEYRQIGTTLEGINDRLKTINGRVGKHDTEIMNLIKQQIKTEDELVRHSDKHQDLSGKLREALKVHIETCPQEKRITKLENENITRKEVKRENRRLITLTSAAFGLILTVYKLLSVIHFKF